MKKNRIYCIGEEISHSISHGIGTLLSIVALIVFLVFSSKQKDTLKIVSLSIYGASLVLLYLSSTLYHSLSFTKSKKVFKRIDHSMIYLLIAGTYTPILLGPLKSKLGWILFGVIWTLAVIGSVFKSVFFGKNEFISTLLYVLMGWLIVIVIKQALIMLPHGLFFWMLSGGIAYTLGVVFYLWKRPAYSHFVWHLFVLTGSFLHFLGIFFYIL
ncbi:hemolysin III family protein [Candidatus Woesearchaeota archaeon]|nr:hemolysin III family protein [Candidatus Woesearchaeota archaeon]